jgi:hypothetical protein
MDRPILTKDTGAAIGLITGIILGSLLLNLAGGADATDAPDASVQSAPRGSGVAAAVAGSADISQR